MTNKETRIKRENRKKLLPRYSRQTIPTPSETKITQTLVTVE